MLRIHIYDLKKFFIQYCFIELILFNQIKSQIKKKECIFRLRFSRRGCERHFADHWFPITRGMRGQHPEPARDPVYVAGTWRRSQPSDTQRRWTGVKAGARRIRCF